MKHKVGDKVRILWDKTSYSYSRDYSNIGEVERCLTSFDGTPLVEVNKFHKYEKWWSLYFPVDAIKSIEVVEDGDAL